jgi:hypothetical protein
MATRSKTVMLYNGAKVLLWISKGENTGAWSAILQTDSDAGTHVEGNVVLTRADFVGNTENDAVAGIVDLMNQAVLRRRNVFDKDSLGSAYVVAGNPDVTAASIAGAHVRKARE